MGRNKTRRDPKKEAVCALITKKIYQCLCPNSNDEITIALKDQINNEREETVSEIYGELMADSTIKSKLLRYAIYYCIFSYYVEVSCINKMYELIDAYGDEFWNFEKTDYDVEKYDEKRVKRFLAHNYSIYSQYHIFKYRENRLMQDYEAAVKYAQSAIEKIKDSRGVFQNYAGIIALGFESGYTGMTEEQWKNAYAYINRAIAIKPDYGLYYCTLGRLQAIQGNYEDADNNINKAIMLEDIDKNTSHRRVARYYMYLADVRLQKNEKTYEDIKKTILSIQKSAEEKSEEIDKIIDQFQVKLEGNIRQQQIKNIELLTFFSGILALIITISGSIGVSDFYFENVGLIWNMGGIVILSFSLLFGVFDYVYLRKAKCSIWLIVSFVVATGLLIGGLLIGRY